MFTHVNVNITELAIFNELNMDTSVQMTRNGLLPLLHTMCVFLIMLIVYFVSSYVHACIHSYVLVYIAITQSNNRKVVIIVISWCQTIIITNFGNSSLHDASEVDCKVLRHRALVSHSDTVANTQGGMLTMACSIAVTTAY